MEVNLSTAFITGVSRGLGLCLAKTLLMRGWRVYGCSRNVPIELINDFPHTFQYLQLEIADAERGPIRIEAFLKSEICLKQVILNAGVLAEISDIRETSLAALRSIMEVNVWANKWLLDTIFSTVPQVDQVVAISSGASVSGSRGWNGYSISKAALNMLIKLYASEIMSTHFTALAPGLIKTAMQEYLLSLPDDERFGSVRRLKEARGTPEMLDPETAAALIIQKLPEMLNFPSGSFVDIRNL